MKYSGIVVNENVSHPTTESKSITVEKQMKNIVAEITKAVSQIQGNQFASLTYLTKKTKELARYTVNLGFSYHKAVEKSVTDLQILTKENWATWSELQKQASGEVMESLLKTLVAHENGTQNDDYTKKGQYVSLGNGLNLNTTDNTIQLFGLLQSKVVLTEGEPQKPVKSAPLTIEKNKIRRQLTVSKFREFALDKENITGVRVNGNTIEMVAPETYGYTVNPSVGVVINPAPKGWDQVEA